jgi:hypothetical protein
MELTLFSMGPRPLEIFPAMLKAISILGYIGMAAGFVALLLMRSVFCTSVFVIALQVAAFLLFGWARLTFGLRSFHLAANPTERWFGHDRAVPLYLASHLYGAEFVCLGGNCRALVLVGIFLRSGGHPQFARSDFRRGDVDCCAPSSALAVWPWGPMPERAENQKIKMRRLTPPGRLVCSAPPFPGKGPLDRRSPVWLFYAEL